MSEDVFFSSDSIRSGGPLKYAQYATFDEPLALKLGDVLPSVTVAYETYGTLSPKKDNAILICHALSGDSHVARHDAADDPGWWDIVVGPGKVIDTDKYFVICPNVLGGCRGTTGPGSTNPATGKPYGPDFPTITTADQIQAQRLLVDHLGIEKLLAVVGGSMGGHQVLTWASAFSDRVCGVIAIATSPRLSSQALAFDVVGRNAILRDPNYQDGHYYDTGSGPTVGLALARMIGHITYLSPEAMREKFETDRLQPRDVPIEFEKKFSVGSYLGYQGAKFVERFDANSYMRLSLAMDLFDLGDSVADLSAAFKDCTCRFLVVSFASDWLFSPAESRQIVDSLIATDKSVTYCNVASSCGHDAFLLEDDLDRYGKLIRSFLANLDGQGACQAQAPAQVAKTSRANIFEPATLDYSRIMDLIPLDANVLDLGCGGGELLSLLKARGPCRTLGVERDEMAILDCTRRGVDVLHADLNRGLAAFGDRQFDFVVLSRTLQVVRDVEGIVTDMLRVGRRCIVSFPNFAYRKLRKVLCEEGRAPEAPGQLHHKWYNTPNIRFLSIADFQQFCADRGICVHRMIALDTEAQKEINDDPNLNADLSIFVISR
ncbi:MAG: homoserine O-acetyltransferase [Phycisphaerae bacterium]|jgi:homoserine O-acetyltransferase